MPFKTKEKMMIGFDLQKVDRIENGDKLLHKIALESEIKYIQKFAKNQKEKIATLWAVKEATFKALDISSGGISFKEIELCHKESGAPFVKLHGKAQERFESLNAKNIEISISHQEDIVGAVVLIN